MFTFSTGGLRAIASVALVTASWAPIAVAQTSEQTAALSCMTLDEFRDHPDVLAYTEATESWATGGLDFGIYLNADLTLVASRAYDGDGAAMLVMATAKMLEAAGYDPGYAVPLLMHGGKPDGSWLEDLAIDIGRLHHRADFSDAKREMLASAQAWYYQLAADGRLQFLGDYGRIERTLYGGPVEHDWLTAEDYKRLAPQYRRQFFPDAIYNGVVAEFVLPGSMSCGVKRFDMSDRIVWRALVEEIYADVSADVVRWQPGSAEKFAVLQSRAHAVARGACEGVRDAYIEERMAMRYRWPEAPAAPETPPNSRRDAAPTQ